MATSVAQPFPRACAIGRVRFFSRYRLCSCLVALALSLPLLLSVGVACAAEAVGAESDTSAQELRERLSIQLQLIEQTFLERETLTVDELRVVLCRLFDTVFRAGGASARTNVAVCTVEGFLPEYTADDARRILKGAEVEGDERAALMLAEYILFAKVPYSGGEDVLDLLERASARFPFRALTLVAWASTPYRSRPYPDQERFLEALRSLLRIGYYQYGVLLAYLECLNRGPGSPGVEAKSIEALAVFDDKGDLWFDNQEIASAEFIIEVFAHETYGFLDESAGSDGVCFGAIDEVLLR